MIEKISIREVLTILVLGAVNIMAVLYGYNELAMSISSGLVGYLEDVNQIGRSKTNGTRKIKCYV